MIEELRRVMVLCTLGLLTVADDNVVDVLDSQGETSQDYRFHVSISNLKIVSEQWGAYQQMSPFR